MGRMYIVQFTDASVSVSQDLFQIESLITPATLHAVYLSQTSDVGDSSAENLVVRILRVTDAVTDDLATVQLDKGDATQTADVAVNETSLLTTGLEVVHSEAWNIALPFIWLPPPEMRVIGTIGDVIIVNIAAPADALTMSGTVYFEESGN